MKAKLLKAATDLHDTLNLDVPVDGLNDEELKEYVKQATTQCLQAGDSLDPSTIALIEGMDLEIPAGVTERKSKEEKEEKEMAKTKEKPAKKAAPAKAEAKAKPAKKVEAIAKKKEELVAKAKAKKEVELDKYGCRLGTKVHDAMKLFETGKYSMAEVKAELGTTFFKKLKHLQELGFTVDVKDHKIKLYGSAKK